MDRRKLTVLGAVVAGALILAVVAALVLRPRPGEPAPTPAPATVETPASPGRADQLPQPGEAPAGAQPARFGDWQMRCDTVPGSAVEQCSLVQTVAAQDRQNVGLLVVAFRTMDGQRANILRVVAPLGVLLTGGLGLRVDETNIGATDFVRCVPNGCIAEARLTDDLLARLRSGRTATFIVFQTPEEGIGIPVSLDGFGAGFDALR